MPPEFNPNDPYFLIRLTGSEGKFPSLLDISSFLYDLNLLYEITRLAADGKYYDFKFSDEVLFRNGRPLDGHDRLHVQSLRQESPLLLAAAVTVAGGAIAGIWALVQIVEKIANAPLNRRKLMAEVEKLERENREAVAPSRGAIPETDEQLRTVLRIRQAERYYDNVAGRLKSSPIQMKGLEIEIVQPNRKKESR